MTRRSNARCAGWYAGGFAVAMLLAVGCNEAGDPPDAPETFSRTDHKTLEAMLRGPCREDQPHAVFRQFLDPPITGWAVCHVLPAADTVVSKELWRTEDGGETWRLIAKEGTPDLVGTPDPALGVLPSPRVNRLIFLDVEDGWMVTGQPGPTLYRTRDGGSTWEARGIVDGSAVRDILVENEETVIALSSTGRWITDDGGATWRLFEE